ncbi:hypothetical protein GCK72_000678 [Caenorhabditis remanei]|uniref:F-box domain-containing protein n=1 Tax=Caenorhabditis remanei TaxID=31234 RepID=A0A6A5HMQ4_CAERE|nr:hypothetical protein GCK72_000678 [Caenorhabditis remanei]KAF1768865.1 hypothetical protein GCK72_000678 [Caenorhabditis remanei]
MKKSIESTMKSRLDKIISITYSASDPDNVSISSSNSNNKEFMKLVPREEAKNRPVVRMNLFGIVVDCCMATRNHPFFILCNRQDGEQMLQTIHNYFRQFFGSSIEYQLESRDLGYIPRLANIKYSNICFRNEATTAQFWDGYLTVSPSQEYIRLYGCGIFENEQSLKLLAQTKVLDLWIPDSRAGDYLKNFKGRHMFLIDGIVTDDDVIQFLNSWKSSQTQLDLEFLSIHYWRGMNLNPEKIMRNLDIKRFDPNQKMPIYRYDRRRKDWGKCDWKIEEFSSPHFIVRDADQHVATLEITTRRIQFAAWKMTEEEVMKGRIQKTFQKTLIQEASTSRNFMNFSKCSLLIQKEILSSMELVDLLMMASCSEKFTRNMKSLMKSRFDKILTITYKSNPLSYINISSSSSGDEPFMSINRRNDFIGRPLISMNLAGMDLQVSMPTRNHPLMILSDLEHQETLLTSIHNYFLDFFGSSIKYQLNVYMLTRPFSQLRNISSTDVFSFLEVAAFHDFLAISPNQDYIRLPALESITMLRSHLLGENLKFARTKVLHINRSNRSVDDVLSNFEGRQLFIDNGIISDTAIIQFLNKWKSNEGYHNLEYFSISVSHSLNPNQIMNSIPINQLDSSDQLPVHQVARKDRFGKQFWRIHKFSSQNYIVRDSDQHVASITITENNITFAAWNMTEKEFLEKRPVKRLY